MAIKYYLDKRTLINGNQSRIEMDNPLNLKKYIEDVSQPLVDASANTTKPYTTYIANITQSGEAAPVATIMENTLGGTPVWTRTTDGVYAMTLVDAFDGGAGAGENVYVIFHNQNNLQQVIASWNNDDSIGLATVSGTDTDIVGTLEVRVY